MPTLAQTLSDVQVTAVRRASLEKFARRQSDQLMKFVDQVRLIIKSGASCNLRPINFGLRTHQGKRPLQTLHSSVQFRRDSHPLLKCGREVLGTPTRRLGNLSHGEVAPLQALRRKGNAPIGRTLPPETPG